MTKDVPRRSEPAVVVTPVVYFARAVDGLDRVAVLAAAGTVRAELRAAGLRMIDPVQVWMRESDQSTPSTADPTLLVRSDLALSRGCDGVLMDMSIPNRNYIGCT